MLLVGASAGSQAKQVELNVADVTDDEAGDFLFCGNINAASDTQRNALLRKTGGGTLVHTGNFGNLYPASNAVSIEAGSWVLGGGESSGQDYNLNGGGLAVAECTTNTVGRLLAASSGKLTVAVGGSVVFADSASADWAPGIRIQVEGDLEGGAIRFGASASALAPSQLAKMRRGSHRVLLDSNGYLRDAGVRGIVVSFR